MPCKKSSELTIWGLIILFALLVFPSVWILKSHMEALAYNRVTGANVSTWDAMWIELRATGDSKNERE